MKKLFVAISFHIIFLNFINGQNVGISTTEPQAKLDVNGTVILGANGTTINAIIRDTIVFNPGPINGQSTQNVDLPVANVLHGSTTYVSCSFPYPFVISSCFAANNFVVVRLTNVSSGSADPPVTTFYITVIQ